MKLCSMEACPHYHTATRYHRKCWHEPQCIKGYVDLFNYLLKLRCAPVIHSSASWMVLLLIVMMLIYAK